MGQSLAKIYLHVIFTTKNRTPYFKDPTLRKEVFAYLAGACRQRKCPSVIVGGHVDHVHMLLMQSKTEAPADFVREIKRQSSRWLKAKFEGMKEFGWQQGYGMFSVSPSHVHAVQKYIAGQEEHHGKISFQEEYRRLLKKYGVDYDERFIWQ